MNDANLIPITERTEEERREIARLGGLAKAENSRKRKAIAEVFNSLLDRKDYERPGILIVDDYYIDIENEDLRTRLCAEILYRALNGNLHAAEIVLRYIDSTEKN